MCLEMFRDNHQGDKQLPSWLSDISPGVSPEAMATGNRMKHTFTLSKIMDFSGLEYCWNM